jgi:hypothetical protein
MKSYPLTTRRKENLKILVEICGELLQDEEKVKDIEFNAFLSTFFTLILYKKNLKSSFLYSICLSKSMVKDLCQVSNNKLNIKNKKIKI